MVGPLRALATMFRTASPVSVDNTKIAAVWPGAEIYDTFIYADTITFGINNSAFAFTISWDTGLSGNKNPNMQGLPIGIYSLDGGTTWYDANGYDGPIRWKVESNGDGTLQFSWTGDGTTPFANVIFKGGLLSQNLTEKLPNPITTSTPVLSFNTGVNYQKVLSTTELSPGSGTASVAHNLGYVPNFRVWIRNTSGRIGYVGSVAVPDNGVYADTSNVNLISNNGIPSTGTWLTGSTWIVRVYKDAA